MTPLRRRTLAVCHGIVCHASFALGVSAMALGLYSGMSRGLGRVPGGWAWAANALLAAQFPLLHSALLGARGRRLLARLAPGDAGSTLRPTAFATIAAWQLIATFVLWTPSAVVLWEPAGAARIALISAFAGSWILLAKALLDAGLGLQTGALGWVALWNGRAPRYPGLPTRGLFAACRQPIYLAFALICCTGPTWTADHALIASAWGAYCVIGPRLKEARFRELYGEAFEAYRARTSYFVPFARLAGPSRSSRDAG